MTARFSAVEIVAADMGKSLAFYRSLGLDIPAEADGEQHVEYKVGGGVSILWDTVEVVRSIDPDWQPSAGGGVGMAFACDDAAEVDRLYADLVAAGHTGEMEPWDAFWGQRYAVVVDPDGNHVDLFAPLPGAAT
ncbi:VOC family protein [Streptomonospora sp. S1-112]|uniref:VOC family protein n=1 Tax=Streptomonospora mangrovi TaxID=2883123 RepID=A0A9X3NNG1_9ACTN|nr:VOC family protein [Streptomonospora mangrovi]MDA0566528.1 VOC family protein [Streptomonospora mangrovi]